MSGGFYANKQLGYNIEQRVSFVMFWKNATSQFWLKKARSVLNKRAWWINILEQAGKVPFSFGFTTHW